MTHLPFLPYIFRVSSIPLILSQIEAFLCERAVVHLIQIYEMILILKLKGDLLPISSFSFSFLNLIFFEIARAKKNEEAKEEENNYKAERKSSRRRKKEKKETYPSQRKYYFDSELLIVSASILLIFFTRENKKW